MKPNNTEPASLKQMLTLGLILALIACPVLAIDLKAEEVPDWEDDEVAFSIAVFDPDAERTGEVPDWEDDEVDLDVYSFVLTLRTAVRLETRGETDTYGQLLDEAGLDLASDDNGGDGANFRIVKTLDPGRYFLGVGEAKGSVVPYVLTATLRKP